MDLAAPLPAAFGAGDRGWTDDARNHTTRASRVRMARQTHGGRPARQGRPGPPGALRPVGELGISSPVMAFPGGSAYAMTRDIAEGYTLVTERTFRTLSPGDLQSLFQPTGCVHFGR